MSVLSQRLRQLRYKYCFSQKTVASRLGVTQSMVSAYESGEREPSLKVLARLSRLYNCSADYLLGIGSPDRVLRIDLDCITSKQAAIINAILESWGYGFDRPEKQEGE